MKTLAEQLLEASPYSVDDSDVRDTRFKHSYLIGVIPEATARKLQRALDGKSFMKFSVSLGKGPGGFVVSLHTNYGGTDIEILTMALNILAES